MKIYTIGFTKTSAQNFFARLSDAGVRKVVDVRLNNVSQLSAFAKRDDLKYFLDETHSIGYEHRTELAPTQDILDEYKKQRGKWESYEDKFLNLMAERKIEAAFSPPQMDQACLLCSEDKPHKCHRRLVAEYLQKKWGGVEIVHL